LGRVAARTGPLHIAIREEAPGACGVQLRLLLPIEIPGLVQSEEELPGKVMVVLRVRVREQIITDPQRLQGLQEAVVVVLKNLPRWQATFISFNGNRRTVRVRARDHQDTVALEPMVACKDIRRQQGAGQVPNVQIAVGVGPGNRNVDRRRHGSPPICMVSPRVKYPRQIERDYMKLAVGTKKPPARD